ncbi:hypothetical protein V8G54_016590 [Vigna mungo]|uniref:Uncharacterized protein n=1 Tax=Vigna mungo TaxID=3915 RepID=A0AAQ3NKH5_VIGMU
MLTFTYCGTLPILPSLYMLTLGLLTTTEKGLFRVTSYNSLPLKMGRIPCCEKVGLKKGPWTPDEDKKLLDYVRKHGHGNWRSVPAKAGSNTTSLYPFFSIIDSACS